MAAASQALTFLAVDTPTASIIAALLAAAGLIAARIAPKTRSEAGVDRSTARLHDAEAWSLLVQRLEGENARQGQRIDELEIRLEEERLDCDRKITALQVQVADLHRRLP